MDPKGGRGRGPLWAPGARGSGGSRCGPGTAGQPHCAQKAVPRVGGPWTPVSPTPTLLPAHAPRKRAAVSQEPLIANDEKVYELMHTKNPNRHTQAAPTLTLIKIGY